MKFAIAITLACFAYGFVQPLLAAAAILWTVWGVVDMVQGADDEE